MRTGHYLTLIGGLAVSAWSLPGDSLFTMGAYDSSRVSASADRQQDRTLLRHRFAWVRSTEDWSARFLDTSLFRYAGSPGVLGGETFMQMGWLQRADSGWSASWRLWNRTDGLTAPDASIAENAWRQMGLVRGTIGDTSLATSVALGTLVEHADPGRTSQGIRADGSAPKGFMGGGVWSWEAAWAGLSETPASISAHWSDLFGGGDLRQAKIGLDGSIQASLTGNGTDTARLEVVADSTRVRSGYLLSDRSDAQRGARASWLIRAGKQRWFASGGWAASVFHDFSERNPDLTKKSGDWMAGVQGNLPWDLSHKQVFAWKQEDRFWQTATTGDPLEDELRFGRDRRDRDQTGEMSLSDTLGWKTDRWGGGGVDLGAVQSLRSIRHPLNTAPTQADRPDEDLSKRQFSAGLRWMPLTWNDKPMLSWSGMSQEDVFLRSVHSAQTWRLDENRLVANLAVPLGRWVRPDLGLWAREQRRSWRFDADRREGLLEYGLIVGGEVGDSGAPWISAQWTRWQVKTGALVGDAFAPDRIQDVWLPEGRIFLHWGNAWRLEPWVKLQLERVSAWGGEGWVYAGRSRTIKAAADLARDAELGGLMISLGYVWLSPGQDEWIGSLSARYAW